MAKIESLTKEQQARFKEFEDRWTKIGLCTEPANRQQAELGIKMAYEAAGLANPKIVWCDSPLSQGLTREIIQRLGQKENFGDSVRASVWASVRDSVRASVGDSGYGQHDANWLAFYDFFSEVCGLKTETKKLEGLWLIAKNAGWFLPHEKICWVSERHTRVHQDEQKRLHCEDGPAVLYADGWAIYAWHGVRVNKQIIEQPLTITVEQIEAQQNAEVRRVMVERFGLDRYIQNCGAIKIHSDDFGVLYRKEQTGDEPLLMVAVVNSTAEPDGHFKDYFLRVHPELRPLLEDQKFGEPQELTAKNAVASTLGKTGKQYELAVQT